VKLEVGKTVSLQKLDPLKLKPGGNYDLVNLYVNRRVSLQKRDLVKV
jgi:hypothetical protein